MAVAGSIHVASPGIPVTSFDPRADPRFLEHGATVEHAATVLRRGEPVAVLDQQTDRLYLAASAARVTDATMAGLVRQTSGFVRIGVRAHTVDRIGLPVLRRDHGNPNPDYTVTVDARSGVTTGISAHDRATTARTIADPASAADDFTRPGHLVPVRVRDGGVLERCQPAESCVDLTELAGLDGGAVYAELVDARGELAGRATGLALVHKAGLVVVGSDCLTSVRLDTTDLVRHVSTESIDHTYGTFQVSEFLGVLTDLRVTAAVHGDPTGSPWVHVVTVTSCTCVTVAERMRCRCLNRFEQCLQTAARVTCGVVVCLPKASDVYSPSAAAVSAQVLERLGVSRVRLPGRYPELRRRIGARGIDVLTNSITTIP